MVSRIVHRWQPTGKTPCGRDVKTVLTNYGHTLSEGVTCKSCKRAAALVSLLGERWHGESAGATQHLDS
jgi:hypothetical protein